jgi:LysM repeat protein
MTEDSATHDFDDIQIVPGAQGSSAPVPQTKLDTPKPQSAAPQPAPAASKQQESKAPVPQNVHYIVYSGDTLGQIAKQHTTTVEALVNANKITDSNKIYVKQKLVIPPGNK